MRLSGQNLHSGMSGDQVAELHLELTRLGSTVPEAEHRPSLRCRHRGCGDGVPRRDGLARSQGRRRPTPRSRGRGQWPHCRPRARPPCRCRLRTGPGCHGPTAGRVRRDFRHACTWSTACPAADITLQAYRRGFGGTAARLGEETRTGPDGRYRIRFDADGGPVNLELRVVQPRCDKVSEIALTGTVFDVAPGDVLNVVAPDVRAAARLRVPAAARRCRPTPGGQRLGAAQQTAEQADLTLLQESTGWDAGLVALAARAEHVAAQTGVTPAAAYAMFRAGLPGDPVGLAGVSAPAVDRALAGGRGRGGRPDPDRARRCRRRVHRVRRCDATRRGRARRAVQPGRDAGRCGPVRRRGRPLRRHRRDPRARGGDSAQLWRQVKAAGLPVDALQRTGKLGYLTLNNAPLDHASPAGAVRRRSRAVAGGRRALPPAGLGRAADRRRRR